MQTLLYRGNAYVQSQDVGPENRVVLKYRKLVYNQRVKKIKAAQNKVNFVYRGSRYVK